MSGGVAEAPTGVRISPLAVKPAPATVDEGHRANGWFAG